VYLQQMRAAANVQPGTGESGSRLTPSCASRRRLFVLVSQWCPVALELLAWAAFTVREEKDDWQGNHCPLLLENLPGALEDFPILLGRRCVETSSRKARSDRGVDLSYAPGHSRN
jgi:hypothetical protein